MDIGKIADEIIFKMMSRTEYGFHTVKTTASFGQGVKSVPSFEVFDFRGYGQWVASVQAGGRGLKKGRVWVDTYKSWADRVGLSYDTEGKVQPSGKGLPVATAIWFMGEDTMVEDIERLARYLSDMYLIIRPTLWGIRDLEGLK